MATPEAMPGMLLRLLGGRGQKMNPLPGLHQSLTGITLIKMAFLFGT